jgi:hypothetical protein
MAGRIAYLGNIATQGLVLNLDAAIKGSYPGTGTTWTDVSNNNNNGTLTNGPTFSSVDYGSIVFDGTDDRVDMVKNSLSSGNTPFSVTAWVNTSKSTRELFFGLDDQSHLDLNAYNVTGPTLSFHRYNSFVMHAPVNSLITGSIQHVVWTYNGTTVDEANAKMYVNGVMKTGYQFSYNVGPFTYDIDPTQANFISNKNPSFSGAAQYTGSVYNLQLYNKNLTPFQVWQNFNAYKSRYGIPDIITDGLVLNLDAGNPYSYLSGSSGTTWTNTVAVSSSISGTLVNGTTYSNGAMTLDGIDDYVQIGTSAVINESLPCTVSVWFKLTELVSGKTPPFCFKTDTGANLVFIIGANSSGYQGTTLIVPGASAARKTDTDTSFFLNNWVNVLITYNGSGASTPSNYGIYENAVLKTQNTGVGGVADPRLNTTLGYVNSNNVLKGSISATQIYNRALTQAEITQNFNALRGRYGI